MTRRVRAQAMPASAMVEIDGAPVEVAVRQIARARRYRLTLDGRRGPVLTVPGGGRWPDAEAFLEGQRDWLRGRLDSRLPNVAFEDGAMIPLRGEMHALVDTGGARGAVTRIDAAAGPLLSVPGGPLHLARRLTDWLRKQARGDLEAAVGRHADRLGVRPQALRIRDQASRWGSCSSTGGLNFSWRLILAPPFVLDYVAAHEVAHLVELNHSPAFWAAVRRTMPEMAGGRDWLRRHGSSLHRYGQGDRGDRG